MLGARRRFSMKKSSDWVIALAVVVSSIFLFVVLFMALRGSMVGAASRVVVVDFPDVMGVNPGAQVKWAGARVGTVSGVRLLTAEERIASGDPKNMVRVTLAIQDRVPAVPEDISASVAADTLLSDKVILLGGGSIEGPALASDQVVQGISPVTIDALVRRNEEPLTLALASLNVTAKNLKVTSTYTKILTRNLTLRPTVLLWGGKPPILPSENEILRARGPVGNPASDSTPE